MLAQGFYCQAIYSPILTASALRWKKTRLAAAPLTVIIIIGAFSKREREDPFPAAKEDDALKLSWNQKERVLHIFDSYCKKILRQKNVDMQRSEVRHRVRECSFSELPSELLAKLCC